MGDIHMVKTQVLKTKDRIISIVKSSYDKRTHKFGIETPKTVDTTDLSDVTAKKMTNLTCWYDAHCQGGRRGAKCVSNSKGTAPPIPNADNPISEDC